MTSLEVINGFELPYCSREELENQLDEHGVLDSLTIRALDQAVKSHGTRVRDSGQPYLEEHIYPVTHNTVCYIGKRDKDKARLREAAAASILHDSVEDDRYFNIEGCEKSFGPTVTSLVYYLTKFGQEADIYIKKLENAPKPAKIIKLFDRSNNLACSIYLAKQDPEKLERYLEETEVCYLPIANLLFDKDFHRSIAYLIDLGHLALDNVGE